jgi:hypothetical protein
MPGIAESSTAADLHFEYVPWREGTGGSNFARMVYGAVRRNFALFPVDERTLFYQSVFLVRPTGARRSKRDKIRMVDILR